MCVTSHSYFSLCVGRGLTAALSEFLGYSAVRLTVTTARHITLSSFAVSRLEVSPPQPLPAVFLSVTQVWSLGCIQGHSGAEKYQGPRQMT